MRPVAYLAFFVALVGCAEAPTGEGVRGTRADVSMAPGVYAGFAVADACDAPSAVSLYDFVRVQGAGSGWFAGVAPGTNGRADALDSFAFDVVGPAVADITSVHGYAWGLGCGESPVVQLWTNDWRDVDEIIGRVGEILADQDLAEEVLVVVEPRSVPTSGS